jgi:putative oxidoreductase
MSRKSLLNITEKFFHCKSIVFRERLNFLFQLWHFCKRREPKERKAIVSGLVLFCRLKVAINTNMKNRFDIPQLFLRLALGIGFLLPVMDRFGWLGVAGLNGNAWGNWENFVAYTNTLLPYLGHGAANLMSMLATAGEAVFGIALLGGYKTRLASLGSCALTLSFAVSMFLFAGMRAPFTYSVFVDSAASLLLAAIPTYKWSLDSLFRADKVVV